MNQDQFVARRRLIWDELAQIIGTANRQGVTRLSTEQVERMGHLYRQAASDLAYARTYFDESATTQYLNGLVGQAHSLIYAEEPQRWRTIRRYFTHEVPVTVRSTWRQYFLAVMIFLVGGAIGCFALLQDPNLAEALIPEAIAQRSISPEERFRMSVQSRPIFGTYIMLNNVRVGVLAFALGVTAGIGTGLVLFTNGIMIGAVAAQAVQRGELFSFWGFILAHGALELMAIFLCGAAGFVMGWPIIAPGEHTRKQAFAKGARTALTLVVGSIPFFVIAAVIEGYITPMTTLAPTGKYAVGIVTGTAGLAYWLFAGREVKVAPAP
jgi:uncharacterized membrane protein SpoIIM required for sporulation